MRVKEKIIAKREDKGTILQIIDRFGSWKYVLLDADGNYIKEHYDANALLKELWS